MYSVSIGQSVKVVVIANASVPSSTVNLDSPVHPLKTFPSTDVTLLGMVMLESPVHPLKTFPSIDVTLLGMVMLESPVHTLNAELLIDCTPVKY